MDTQKKIEELKAFEQSLEAKTLEELQALEQEIVKEAEEADKEVSSKEFKLDKKNYQTVAQGIRDLLNKKTVQWQFTLGMVAMYDFWDPEKNPGKVLYPMLDGTLRALGDATFTGYEEWASVVAINKYFEGIRQEYIDTTEKVYDIAAKHNAVIDAMNKKTPIGKIQDEAQA